MTLPPSNLEEGGSKEECLERAIWSLQADFQNLLKEDSELASQFLEWAVREWERAIKIRGDKGAA